MAELHRPRNSRLGQVSPHSHMMLVTLEVLPHRCSTMETPSRGHLTHQYSSCKFSRNCPAGKMGTLQEGIHPERSARDFKLTASRSEKESQGEHHGFCHQRHSCGPGTRSRHRSHRRAHLSDLHVHQRRAGQEQGLRLRANESPEPQSAGTHGCQAGRRPQRLRFLFGLEFSFVDTSVPDFVRRALRPNTKMLYLETPANPTLSVTDIAAISKLASERNLSVVVDNTFLSPYLQRPIELGAHIVVHSMTKYLNGHSDSTGGAVVLTRPEDAEKIYFIQRSAGTGLSPMDCFLVSRGIKTLAVRMLQHNANGITVARHLDAHPKVKKVFYPGLPSHPQHEVARRQQKGPGAMLSFDVGSLEAARRFLNHVKLCSLAESLGGVETLISLPAMMTHASMPKEVQDRVGITEGLVRLSVGIEDVEDIIADLDQALLYV